ncbi:MAG TPA: type 4a pilus biogenesis protein PilO [Candidatus Paceibacterota bacterium]|nr:type 4a pilus biogenesis protein PilO [Candidatus Paceibacterota bacterium]
MINYKKDKRILIVVMSAFVVAFAVTAIWSFVVYKKTNLIEIIKSEINSQLSQNYLLFSTPKNVADLKNKDQIITGNFIKESEIVSLIDDFEFVSDKKGIELRIENLNQKKDSVLGNYFELNLKSSGNYQNNIDFLEFVEKLPYSVYFESVKIERVNNSTNSDLYNFNLLIKILSI